MYSYPQDAPPMSDAQLQLELLQRLKLDISEELAPAKPVNEEEQVSIKLSKKLHRKDKAAGAIQLEEWIEIMEPLLEKEKSAEARQPAPRCIRFASSSYRRLMTWLIPRNHEYRFCGWRGGFLTTPLRLRITDHMQVEEAKETLATMSSAASAARGRTLMNLKCQDVESGLMGRSLLTLVSNRQACWH